jgi:type VI secretion system secreted protein Hcp
LIAVGAAGVGAAIAVAAVPDSSGVIHACVAVDQTGKPLTAGANLRVIDPSVTPPQTCNTVAGAGGPPEATLDWNITGPRGLQGLPGANGGQGPPGNTLTINGQTFSISGLKQTGTINNPSIAPLPPNPSGRPVGTLSLDLGPGAPPTIEVLSWSFGASNSGAASTGSGGGAGKVKFNEFTIKKTTDSASPAFFKNCVSGTHFKKVVLVLRKAGGESPPFLSVTLKNAVISSYQQSNSGGDRPVESVSFNFAKIEFKYEPPK